ncbi:sugar ABC transporter ATP-binding protein [Herbiconiux moechotypicola]|uniref:sugar ABC transporter ATP-binding protein n=1 Tax=Herbiconiux moechotypicola TaxID=637393 RepID=UPI00217DD8A9|nr:sugar ABC transporter ATP-binding protein [Herbiconiux moechotypicola]MCS5731672.1 sugar ABC transporter ATP-binding protein [Herbiconiux moechotypicola]
MILQVENLSKKYGNFLALENASFEVKEGSVHALCGENGAGKSTLIKMLSGAIVPTSGRFVIDGVESTGMTPREAMNHGIRAIYQEFSLVPFLTVAENIFYGREPTRAGFCDFGKMKDDARALCREMGVEIDPGARVETLGVAQQQIVEILKAVSSKARLLIMDEPTASLTVGETQVFYDIVRRLQAAGTAIIYISHRLEEVFSLCDEVSVLCDGRMTATRPVEDVTRRELISLMVGRDLVESYPESSTAPGAEVLRVSNLENDRLHDVSFALHAGEILGFGGLIGAGRTELAMALMGELKIDGGTVLLRGADYRPRSSRYALTRGIGLIPEDRKHQGVVMSLSVKRNVSLGILDKLSNAAGILSRAREDEYYDKYATELAIKTATPNNLVSTLSGGNQQKVVVAKVLARDCEVIIFDEPTRGIDVGAKHEIYGLMRELADQGKAIILISSDMPELLGMSDRIAVMSAGYLVADLGRGEADQATILELASTKLAMEEGMQ